MVVPVAEAQLEVLRTMGAQPEQLEGLNAKTARTLYEELIAERKRKLRCAEQREVDKIVQQDRDEQLARERAKR